MSRLGNSRNDGRTPKMPKDPKKAEREMAIREFAKNNGFSIATARIMFEESEAEEIESEETTMTSAYLRNGELRVYNRDNTKAHSCVAFPANEKAVLKKHGFKWDARNHSYYLENPSDDAIAAIKGFVTVEGELPQKTTAKDLVQPQPENENTKNGASLQAVIAKLENLFEVFNKHFFNGELETPVIAVSPDTTKGAYGWCTTWKAWQGAKEGGYYEINMCAEHLSRPFPETCGMLIHEMVHLKNLQDKIQDCSRSGKYHNKRFKDTAELYGLMVEKDAKYGWCRTKLTDETIEWLKTEFPDESGFTLHRDRKIKLTSSGKSSSSRKYVCPECGTIIRATKEVNVECADCGVAFEER